MKLRDRIASARIALYSKDAGDGLGIVHIN